MACPDAQSMETYDKQTIKTWILNHVDSVEKQSLCGSVVLQPARPQSQPWNQEKEHE